MKPILKTFNITLTQSICLKHIKQNYYITKKKREVGKATKIQHYVSAINGKFQTMAYKLCLKTLRVSFSRSMAEAPF